MKAGVSGWCWGEDMLLEMDPMVSRLRYGHDLKIEEVAERMQYVCAVEAAR